MTFVFAHNIPVGTRLPLWCSIVLIPSAYDIGVFGGIHMAGAKKLFAEPLDTAKFVTVSDSCLRMDPYGKDC